MELQLDLLQSINPGKGPGPNQDCGTQKIKRTFHEAFNRNSEVKDDPYVVGWPPVKSWGKQFCRHLRRGCATNYVNVENTGGDGDRRGPNYMYVKVKMEGIGITRKVDLSNYHSYQTLVAYLIALFGKCQENAEDYKLIYQNKEGDWLHARDVPWENLRKSVQRLKMEKNVSDYS